jgi:hypothetical protein
MACGCCNNNTNTLGTQTVISAKPLLTQQVSLAGKLAFPLIPQVKMVFLPRQMPTQVFLNRFNTGR